jgi:hypothetical protein
MWMLNSGPRTAQRRYTPRTYKLVLTSHIIVGVAWLGVVLSKLALALAALTSAPHTARSLYTAMEVLNVVFPPLVIATLISGVALTLGTRWALLDYYWTITKLGLTIAVFTTGAQFSTRLAQTSLSALPDPSLLPSRLLLTLLAAHTLMLAIATVVSVFKPWGPTPLAPSR